MSTRGNICIENTDGTLDFIYCHSDCYPSNVGLILYTFYNTEVKVRKLISLGDLSSLGPRIGNKTDFNKIPYLYGTPEYEQIRCQCIAYARDRGEHKNISHCKDRETYFANEGFDINYTYIFKDGIWYVKWPSLSRMHKLKNVLEEDWVKKGKRNQNIAFYINDSPLTRAEKIDLYKAYEELHILDTFLKLSENN